VQVAVDSYIAALASGTSYDVRGVLRLVQLWLAHSADAQVCQCIHSALQARPSCPCVDVLHLVAYCYVSCVHLWPHYCVDAVASYLYAGKNMHVNPSSHFFNSNVPEWRHTTPGLLNLYPSGVAVPAPALLVEEATLTASTVRPPSPPYLMPCRRCRATSCCRWGTRWRRGSRATSQPSRMF
jgi:hypothetical protein